MTVQQLNTKTVLKNSNVAFGTSGARGLVEDFTPQVCAAFTHAFLSVMKESFEFSNIAFAIDNRPSSYNMAKACAYAAEQLGLNVDYYGVVPTPALALKAMKDNIPCMMITGSHIPFDRNGLKFYRPDGEISKADEQAINSSQAQFESIDDFDSLSELTVLQEAANDYISRYTTMYNNKPLSGKCIGIYEHSSAGRDLYADIFEALGAAVISLERTDTFVPIDTEAVSEEDCKKARDWSKEHNLDAIFSTDGDGDRPLVSDENGNWLRGDVLGLLCAQALSIDALAVPVSCNTAIEKSGAFKQTVRTKIGSPYVIAEFESLAEEYASVAGFEANGGFLLGSKVNINGVEIEALPTRDAVLPAVSALLAAPNGQLSKLVEQLPQRFTDSDRIKNFATEKSKAIISTGAKAPESLVEKLGFNGAVINNVNTTDGLRITFESNDIIHLRPSGNAPELRCYAESSNEVKAKELVVQSLDNVVKL
ncbi:phosphomannomutase [Thalassotalea eurytherma]|uniref:Phosphomannomutase n=1 Tax=Thalassotalea eurytherma TaxID=1144278 RepID=A0ABQ6H359_9GAMM|nr:phosphomannomutase [Thalassotalea eurytherma]GLX81301.1 phosphomannomutase [Thalassotalea eurytherma]